MSAQQERPDSRSRSEYRLPGFRTYLESRQCFLESRSAEPDSLPDLDVGDQSGHPPIEKLAGLYPQVDGDFSLGHETIGVVVESFSKLCVHANEDVSIHRSGRVPEWMTDFCPRWMTDADTQLAGSCSLLRNKLQSRIGKNRKFLLR